MFHMSMIVLGIKILTQYLNIRPEAIKLLGEKIWEKLFDIGLSNNYFWTWYQEDKQQQQKLTRETIN